MASSPAGPAPMPIPSLSGTIPGVIDFTQRQRLLRLSNSTLSFAYFDPQTASSSQVSEPRINGRPKRIVLEYAPTGECSWRFVPNARLEGGATDEGVWPRVIEICGQKYYCSEDQWDIYKLDNNYLCRVFSPPAITVIHLNSFPPPQEAPDVEQSSQQTVDDNATEPPPSPGEPHLADEDDDFDEVESMMVDDDESWYSPRSNTNSDDTERERHARFESDRRQSQSMPPETKRKRKGRDAFRSVSPREEEFWESPRSTKYYAEASSSKRTRAVSPSDLLNQLYEREQERARRKQEKRTKWEKKMEARRRKWEEQFMKQVYDDLPNEDYEMAPTPKADPDPDPTLDTSGSSGDSTQSADASYQDNNDSAPADDITAEESARLAALEESRRKMAELEADRPLWEQAAREREQREQAESEALRQRREAKKREEVRQAHAEAERKAQAKRAAEMQEKARRQGEESAQQQRAQEKKQRCGIGRWTTKRAVEHYLSQCAVFDQIKWSETRLTFDMVPWPILKSPAEWSVEDIDWTAIEQFFEAFALHVGATEYKSLVSLSHKRFHPDRWRGRGMLSTVPDDEERNCLEVAATTVSQAITPLWRDSERYAKEMEAANTSSRASSTTSSTNTSNGPAHSWEQFRKYTNMDERPSAYRRGFHNYNNFYGRYR